MIIQVAVAMAATLAFSILFSAPARHWFLCSVAGGSGWFVYLMLTGQGVGATMSTFFATFVLAALTRLMSIWKKAPVTVFLTSGIFPLVPGAGIYYTAYYLFSSDFVLALAKGVDTLKTAGAIVLGILFGFAIPQKIFFKICGR